MSEIDISKLPRRQWAHPFDHAQPGETESRGHDASSDAIGGYYGCQWEVAFRNRKTGELYAVNCYDGTNSSKNQHEPEDEDWMQRVQEQIIVRTRRESQRGATQVCLSREEWAVMSGRIFSDWFDLLPGERYKSVGDENRHKLVGHVGTINSIPVVVDPALPNPLGNPPCDARAELERELARIDEAEDLAESLGY